MKTLNDYTEELRTLLAGIEELEPELQAQAIDAWLSDTDGLSEKLDAYAAVIADYEGKAELRSREADRLADLAKTDRNEAKRLKNRLLWFLDTTGRDKIETDYHKFSVVSNGGRLPLIIEDDTTIPAEFRRTITLPDNDAIFAALQAGQDVPGARLGERGKGLRIR